MKKPGYQNKNIRQELEAGVKHFIKIGYGNYYTWIGYCEDCKKLRVHTEATGISYRNATCSQGHYSEGKVPAKELLKNLKKRMK